MSQRSANLPAATCNGHLGAVVSVVYSQDGKTLASANSDTTILVWNLDRIRLDDAPLNLDEKELKTCWECLAGDDAQIP